MTMMYEYRCTACNAAFTSDFRGDRLAKPCNQCGHEGPLHRVFRVSVKPMMHEHFNHTTGTPISDMRQFERELRVAGEVAEEQTGIPHKYAALEYGDHAAFGADGDGIYESNVERSRRGEPILPLIE